ncbi:MAG: pyridoxamine 5'-phosphate oxidase [Verrucomicrobiota bacterium]
MKISDLRKEYSTRGLQPNELDADPIRQFRCWFQEAQRANLLEPNAMTLSTASSSGLVTSRTVLLKAFDHRGFVFFTNYESLKAKQIQENPQVSLLFPWIALERQLHINGKAEKIATSESLSYFISRPFNSKIGAWVSQQSSIISSRKILEAKFDELSKKFAQGEIPLPSFWGGFRVVPASFEFWQGSASRLHDRFRYRKDNQQGTWTIERLSP